jgi:hypothetical protein
MKIIAITDLHGAFPVVHRILSSEKSCDAIVIGGDLTTHGTVEEARKAIAGFTSVGIPLFIVAGNMDPPSFDDAYASLGIGLNGRGIVHQNVGFFGVSGSPFTPMHTPYEISEEEIERRAESGWGEVVSASLKVFVPHAPPHNTKLDRVFLGKHVGSTAVRKFIERRQPNVVICGHIHEARGQDSIGTTKIVNCGPAHKGYYAVVQLGPETSIETRELKLQ